MFLTILLILSAFGLSSIAGYYSVAGMTAIFAASWWPIVIMTGTLEFSKIVVSSWLYRNWDRTPTFLRAYFTAAVVILMFITSLGIFGYLSKAHIDQLAGVSDNPLFIQQIDQQIAIEQARVEDGRKIISQMDNAVGSILSQSTTESTQKANKGANMAKQANALRDSQKKDRAALNKQIDESNAKIRELNKEKLKLEQEQIKIEAEVGPIKYIAQMIYGDNPDKNLLEKAVRYIIVLIIVVFDPLAVLMFMAANMSIAQMYEDKKNRTPPPLPSQLNEVDANSKKKEYTEFVDIDEVEITVPNVATNEESVDAIEKINDAVVDEVKPAIESELVVKDNEIAEPIVEQDFVIFEEVSITVEDSIIPDLEETVIETQSIDFTNISINDLILLQELVEDVEAEDLPFEKELVIDIDNNSDIQLSTKEPVIEEIAQFKELELVDNLIENHFKELPLVDEIEETIQSKIFSTLEPDVIEEPITVDETQIDSLDAITEPVEVESATEIEKDPVTVTVTELIQNDPFEPIDDPELIEMIKDEVLDEAGSNLVVEAKVEELETNFEDLVVNSNAKTYIDGKLIEEFLTSTREENVQIDTMPVQANTNSDQMLHTEGTPAITKKPNDILSTIKRYHNVRLDDAKRTLR